jgi:hypothetical protein
VTVIGSGEDAGTAEQIRRKEHGWGTLGALERARRHRAEEWARCREEVKAGRMSQGQAQDARHDAALKVQGAWSGGCRELIVRINKAPRQRLRRPQRACPGP